MVFDAAPVVVMIMILFAVSQEYLFVWLALVAGYAGLSLKELEWVKNELEKLNIFDRILLNETSAAIALKSGPGTVGFFYQLLEDRR